MRHSFNSKTMLSYFYCTASCHPIALLSFTEFSLYYGAVINSFVVMGNHKAEHEHLFQLLLCPTRKITQNNMTLLNEFFPFWKLHITSRQETLKIIIFYKYNINTCYIGNVRGLLSDFITFFLLFSQTWMKYLTLRALSLERCLQKENKKCRTD